MEPIRIAIVGVGKIAQDQHLPAIAGNPAFRLAATVSRHDPRPANPVLEGVPNFATLADLLATGPQVDAVSICTPPQVRYDIAAAALAAGLHVFLEKPPGATLSEVKALKQLANGRTLFASWHSRYAAGVEPAKAWLCGRRVEAVKIVWREDVRVWHPGQAWIWEAGGLGVFDPGINALSIATHILPGRIFLREATLTIPENCAAPIAADLRFADVTGAPVHMDLDWRQTGPQSWDIVVDTDAGQLKLSKGGAVLDLPDGRTESGDVEYPGLYRRFAGLIHEGVSDVDCDPLRLVADAFLRGRRERTEAFYD